MTESKRHKPATGVRLDPAYLEQIDAIAKTTGRTRSQVIVEAVERYLGATPVETIQSDLEQVLKRLQDMEENTFTRLEELEKKLVGLWS